ncbi:LLM class flavin-dependent oxidoreductase [Paenibacillus sp. PCH8]|uniref:LLM class flavin-dependent oxidoreductase n=1 Tax=Paenibacillus sp. PCH8 TaxID=2066524 RepID=UPI000CF9DDDB|nr:LLM class flavin-dependent oxidoreductase [Paenibacillus sp. PCH8]PQP81636.1 LLM class flavin-dependent oxidoreductase [Paenibacillus sp. PCH8]
MEQYRIHQEKGMEIGLYSIGDHLSNPLTGHRISAQQRINELIETAKLAEEAGLDVFAVGESHQPLFATQAHTVILGAVAQATKTIKIASSATVLSTSDPVRVYEDFATLDLISNGRAEIVAGRGSRLGSYELLGFDVSNYEELFEEKLALLLKINEEERVTWQGEFRAPLHHAEIIPQPLHGKMPIWRAVGGPPASAIKAGLAGVPMMLTTLGGPSTAFKTAVDRYRDAARSAGFDPAGLPISTTSLMYVAEDSQTALREYYPHINNASVQLRGSGYPEQQFLAATDYRDALMVGSPQQIIEKMLYQYEMYGQQRFLAEIDAGGVSMDQIKKNIELLATIIMPAVKKHTQI